MTSSFTTMLKRSLKMSIQMYNYDNNNENRSTYTFSMLFFNASKGHNSDENTQKLRVLTDKAVCPHKIRSYTKRQHVIITK